MYLNKVRMAWSAARNPYELHRVIWRLFPGHEQDPRGFLFRVEAEQRGHGRTLLVQSVWQPEAVPGAIDVLAARTYVPSLRLGQRLRFRLVGNPVKTIRDGTGRQNAKGEIKPCRVPLIREEQQLGWLNRKLHGAAHLEMAEICAVRPLYFRKRGKAGKVVMVTFDGVLHVHDPGRLWQCMQDGIGPAKGFGCGLLSIATA
ncbi:type I-E CRISPR-associated protein Cas6/Cse3/CasE [Candidatus Entotheonella palauensis]|uniref:CRISPR-associated protein n=1 Tax=Candidatus Entotheonella gemina TaxID=1429439 RepID=W4MBY7_9BACT|nr:type I-E CRISPR-associated protein Cas6/Cse3/CasE [Candidatus Entotheonella palauensis]ETX07421.1 MAG: CRISPR-associated protein [Candidatus Entotheonella gemina]